MDQRQTFNDISELLSFVTKILKEERKVSLLIEKEGLARLEGIITSINQHSDIGKTSIVIDNGNRILLKDIIGINGLFRSDYSEC